MTQKNGAAASGPINLVPVEFENAPRIKIGGLEFPIPVLAWMQVRIVVPGLVKLGSFFKKVSELVATAGSDPFWWINIDFSTEQLDIMADVVYTACTRANPGFGRGEFNNMPINPIELMQAIGVIGGQTGMMARQGGAPSAGEKKPAPAGEQVPETGSQTLTL